MGLLQKGKWVDHWYETKNDGKFVRQNSQFTNWISDHEDNKYKIEKGRYHLYVSLACPWAHRTLIYRELKQLHEYIDVTVVKPEMLEKGWVLDDPLYDHSALYQLYLHAKPNYEGRVTVPVLWDKKTQTIVNNESSQIIRILNTAFNHLTGNTINYYPHHLQNDIDNINERIYETINNGVYRAGFATSQEAYEDAFHALFDSLDWLESILSKQRYLVGNQITEADWRLFTTLIRFDAVYFGHFKTNRQQIADYPALSAYVRDLYQIPGIAETVNFEHIKIHYYLSHSMINPTGVVPLGPQQDFMLPHGRDQINENL